MFISLTVIKELFQRKQQEQAVLFKARFNPIITVTLKSLSSKVSNWFIIGKIILKMDGNEVQSLANAQPVQVGSSKVAFGMVGTAILKW
jgi:predicted secreted protein